MHMIVGGSLLYTSHNSADVRRGEIIKYCFMDNISLSWMKERINSLYRPYPNKAKGSLLSTVKEGTDFEERFLEKVTLW